LIENSRAALDSELQTLQSSSTISTSESQALQARINSLETSNSDVRALLETKTSANDALSEELAAQQQKVVALRREVSELEEKNQSAGNASMAAKFREQTLQQEVDLLKKNSEWHEEELKRRGSEYTKYRKEKGAQIAELQRLLEDTTQTNEGLRSTEVSLRNRLDETNQKLDDAHQTIQAQTDNATKNEQSLRAERDSALRLADLQKKSAETARARQQELERSVGEIRDDAATEIGNLQADIATERTEKEKAEQRIAELETQVEALQNELSAAQHVAAAPSTPRRNVNGIGSHATPGRESSPGLFSSPGGTRLKGNLTVTQLYTQYSKVKAEAETLRQRNEQLTLALDEMVQDLEQQAPEAEELRIEKERLAAEVGKLNNGLHAANQERDIARKAARKWEGTASGLARESELLRQQLRDLSAQLKMVLVVSHSREQGLEALSAVEQSQLEQLARGEIEEGDLDGMSDTGRFISQRLTIFRDVAELQEQNSKLLRLTRELGEKMESEEAKAKQNHYEQLEKQLEDAQTRLSDYQDTIKSLTARSESYVQERDMYRRMATHRGQVPPGTDVSALFGQSVDAGGIPGTPGSGRGQSIEPSQDSQALVEYRKLIKDLQQHFDAYRQEASTDQMALKQQADQLSREKSELQGEVARVNSQLTLARERYEMVLANFDGLRKENGELLKRTQHLSEIATRQDIRTQQVAEELIEARGLADSMRNETANLKAERELWKKIEGRLTEDNRSLMDERSRLNKMVTDLQSLQNERELTESENRRKLQNRMETLESELSAAKRKLDEEVDQSRKAALRQEFLLGEKNTRIDDLLKSASNAKADFAAAKAQRDQLQSRLDEMKIELKTAEETVQALQPRPTSGANTTGETNENALTREQELAVEIADLKHTLELKQNELQQAEDQVEQYKSIAQAAEEALQSNTDTTEQYRESTDQEISEKDAKIQDLQKRVDEISSELAETNAELSNIRSKHEENAGKLSEQQAVFESELARLRDENDRLGETARLHQEDLRAQAEISQQAQQHYEDELVKHAEAATNLQKIRGDFNQLKTEVAGYKAEAEAAKVTLSQNEESWSETRTRYEQEVTDLKNRREDVLAQNRLLHQQLDEVSTQIAALKKTRGPTGDDVASATPEPSDNSQELIRYLRQEKEIVDVQWELSIQEGKRLQQQLDHAQAQLDQTRETLEKERQSNSGKEQDAANHNKLLTTINELNLYRESNNSLRIQARSAQDQLSAKIKEAEELVTKIEPIQTRLREVEQDLEAKEGEVKLLQEDRDRWQKRTQDIMQKYDRVDPAELEALKTQITTLQAEKESLLAEKQSLQEQVDGIPERVRLAQEESAQKWQESRAKLIEQSKNRNRDQLAIIRQKDTDLATAATRTAQVSQELAAAKEELEQAKAARNQALAQTQRAAAPQDGAEDGQIDESSSSGVPENVKAEYEARIAMAEAKANSEAANALALQQQIQTLQARVQELEGQIVSSFRTFQHVLILILF
jgi:nucleoprotein TPR